MIVTFKQLGNYGRIGNSLFEMAATIGYAKKYGVDYVFPKWEHSDFFNIPQEKFVDIKKIKNTYQYDEPKFEYSEIPFKENLNLHGYFQSWKYFNHCKDYIKNIFSPKVNHYNKDLYNGMCSIHVRRTDYLKFPNHHPVLYMDYYKEAMDISNCNKFIIISDDPEWCFENFKSTSNKEINIVSKGDAYFDFSLMISIENSIIANSSFSWWAAWLGTSPNKKVVAPKNWFGPALKPTHPIDDLIPPDWVLI